MQLILYLKFDKMDFTSDLFPGQKLHIALYDLLENSSTTDILPQRKE